MLHVAVGELVDQPVQAIVHPASSRGVMGGGPARSVRSAAGEDVEREAMAHAPIDLGAVVLTNSGRLASRGIEIIVHAAIVPTLGDTSDLLDVRRAMVATLRALDERRIRSLALPLIGVSAEAPAAERAATAEALVDDIVAHLRRPGAKLERIVFVTRFDDDLGMLEDVIKRARGRSWTSPA